ncbi:MAG: class I SAM-dependent methyltransferase [Candidatus Paceibacterota bacterium]|jgi:SAM-dependent methyltransferase
MTLNNYDKLAATYKKSDIKPDKQFSILPTVLGIIGYPCGKVILDLGCGDGFFTHALASLGARHVIGIDNSKEQIRLANANPSEHVTFQYGDIFKDMLSPADIILSPFVVNYANSVQDIEFLFGNIMRVLSERGKVILVVDLPKGENLKKFGSVKILQGPPIDGTKIKIDLYNSDELICTLFSHYFTPATLENALKKVGFKNIIWHKTIISEEGIEKFGIEFWKDYCDNSELGYVSAEN